MTQGNGAASPPNAASGAIDIDGWRQRIRADAFSRYHCEMGRAIRAEGNAEAAIGHFTRAIDIDPGRVDAYYHLGALFEEQGRAGEAAELYARARAADPDFPAPTLVRLALFRFDAGDADGAAGLLERVLTLRPGFPTAVLLLGLIRFGQDRAEEARTLWAGVTVPAAPPDAMVPELDADVAQTLTVAAARLHGAGRSRDAGEILSYALALDPVAPLAHQEHGALLLEDGRPVEAEAALRRALALGYDSQALQEQLGAALASQGRHSEALVVLSAAAEQAPDNLWLQGQFGQTLVELGRAEEALPVLRKAANGEAGAAWIQGYLGLAYWMVGALPEAHAALSRAVAADPGNAWLLERLGWVLESGMRFNAAAAVYRQALALTPRPHWVDYMLGSVLLKTGHVAEAAGLLRNAVVLAPEQVRALASYGRALLVLGRAGEAVPLLVRGLVVEPAALRVLESLAAACLKSGRMDEADAALERGWTQGLDPAGVFAVIDSVWNGHDIAPDLDALAAARPGRPWIMVQQGLAALIGGQPEGASRCFAAARAAADGHPWPPAFLGLAALAAGRLAEADAAFADAVARGGVAWRTYEGLVHHLRGDLDAAAAAHDAAIRAQPDDPLAARLHLGLTLMAQGRQADGGTLFQRAAGDQPVRAALLIRLLPSALQALAATVPADAG